MSDLEWAIDAFDRLYAATCKSANPNLLVAMFGASEAQEIAVAKLDVDKLRGGFISRLTSAQREPALAYRGDENHGEGL